MAYDAQISLTSLGKNLKLLRLSRDISQADMADALGLTRSSYAQYELGNRMPDARILFTVARFFKIDMELLFEGNQVRFLGEVVHSAGKSISDERLFENYRLLSPFSKGRLLEFSEKLVEWDRIKENNLKVLEDRRQAE